jgi:hypothetical protein
MNTTDKPQVLFREDQAPLFLQDKEGSSRLSAASPQPSTAEIMALNSSTVPENRDPNKKAAGNKKHSTKRQTVFAGSWIDPDTDFYIQNRQRKTRDSKGKKFTRSKVIALMLRERAQDETFQSSQSILMPMIQETMRQEFKLFANRFLAVIAKIAYQVGWILMLQLKFMGIVFRKDQAALHQIEQDAETAARVNVAKRTPQAIEAEERVRHEIF